MTSSIRIISLLFLLIIFAAGIYIRYDNLSGHFTHTDDLMVATNLMKKSRTERITEAIQKKDSAAIKAVSSSGLYKDLNNLKDSPFLYSCAYYFFKNREKFNIVSKMSTFAPLQCGMTSWLVKSGDSSGYETIKFKGRFWSFIFGSLSVVGIALFLFYLYKEESYAIWLAVFGASVMAYSWENIIYSQQMEPYTIAVFFHILLLIVLHKYHDSVFSWKRAVLFGLLAGFLSWGQYQILFCSVAFFAVITFLHRGEKYFILKSVLMGICFACAVQPLLGDIQTTAGVNWNAGINGEFLFSTVYEGKLSLIQMIAFPFKYFFSNTYITVRGMIGFIPDEFSLLINLFTVLFLVLMSFGLYSLFISWKKDSAKSALFLYVLFLSLIWMGLIVIGKITLSPTRHSLVLLPVFILLAAEGIVFVFKKRNWIPSVVTFLVIVQSVAFFYYYPKEVANRKDRFSEEEIEQLISQYKPGLVLSYNFTDNILLMRNAHKFKHTDVRSHVTDEFLQNKDALEKYTVLKNLNPQRLLLVSTRSAWDKEYNRSVELLLGIKMQEYKEIWKKEITSSMQVEYSVLTSNGGNELYLKVMERL